VIDPVMGDDGEIDLGMPEEMPKKIRALIADADIVTPNMTEYSLLTGETYSLRPRTGDEAEKMLDAMLDMGARAAVITSLPLEDGLANAYKSRSGAAGFCRFERLPAHYPGTGDLFASVLTGAVVNGLPLEKAVSKATRFTRKCIERSIPVDTELVYGVQLEPMLSALMAEE